MIRVAGVLLAAGGSRRFGAPSKLLADLGGRPVIDWAAAVLEAADLVPRVGVVRAGDDPIHDALAARGFEVVANPRAEQGVGASIAAGARWAEEQGADAALIALGDAPFMTSALVGRLLRQFVYLAEREPTPVVALENGRPTSPAIFPRELFSALASLDEDRGARAVLGDDYVGVPAAPGELDDVDTPEALETLRARLAAQ